MSRNQPHPMVAPAALAATLLGFSGVIDDPLSLSLMLFALLAALALAGKGAFARGSIRGSR